uniref:Piezo THU9 and anchor domain-containing protein n=1 Tax=Knipowitschia caucasica TaxID=637954 RepID=A0AAV2M258_KNICA
MASAWVCSQALGLKLKPLHGCSVAGDILKHWDGDVASSLLSDFYVVCNGRVLEQDQSLDHGLVYRLEPRLRGGKGGDIIEFRMVPFLTELRAVMDWVWTDTTLSLSSWICVEDIYANIFILKCWRESEKLHLCRNTAGGMPGFRPLPRSPPITAQQPFPGAPGVSAIEKQTQRSPPTKLRESNLSRQIVGCFRSRLDTPCCERVRSRGPRDASRPGPRHRHTAPRAPQPPDTTNPRIRRRKHRTIARHYARVWFLRTALAQAAVAHDSVNIE